MSRNLILGFVFCAILSAESGMAQAQNWQRYVDPGTGSSIAIPANMLSLSERFSSGAVFRGGPAKLEVSAKVVPGIRNSRDLRAFVARAPGYDRVDYMPSGSNWLVVSGYRGAMIFYEKYFVAAGGLVDGFSFEYPTALRHVYDPILESMEDSFRPGRQR